MSEAAVTRWKISPWWIPAAAVVLSVPTVMAVLENQPHRLFDSYVELAFFTLPFLMAILVCGTVPGLMVWVITNRLSKIPFSFAPFWLIGMAIFSAFMIAGAIFLGLHRQ